MRALAIADAMSPVGLVRTYRDQGAEVLDEVTPLPRPRPRSAARVGARRHRARTAPGSIRSAGGSRFPPDPAGTG